MKTIQLISGLLLLATTALAQDAQDKHPSMDNIPDEILRKIGVLSVNKFMLAVIKMTECPCANLDGTLELFAPNAYIEVSNIKGRLTKYTPLSYFRTVNALKCGKDAIYKSMKFDYRPVSANDATILRFNGTCTVSYQVTQTFVGFTEKGNKTYSDKTKKTITINLLAESAEIQPKIIAITVDTTENYPINEEKAIRSK
jgi:hypothetical protein